jgi:uncharacterized protein YcbK (DUF882 family)
LRNKNYYHNLIHYPKSPYVVVLVFFSTIIILAFQNYTATKLSIDGNNINTLLQNKIQKEILTYHEIDSVLNTFQKIPYSKLDTNYLKITGYQGRPDEYKVSNRFFYKLVGFDVFKNLVGKHSVNEFLPKDKFRKENYNLADSNYIQYILIDTAVLHRFLDLILLLKKSGYNDDALTIMDGYRYPAFNNETGGAGFSQHIYGKAIDLEIGDINRDSIIDEIKDKKIIIDLLDKKIIKKSGGIGLYPGTQIVHFDTRGKYVRWKEQ